MAPETIISLTGIALGVSASILGYAYVRRAAHQLASARQGLATRENSAPRQAARRNNPSAVDRATGSYTTMHSIADGETSRTERSSAKALDPGEE